MAKGNGIIWGLCPDPSIQQLCDLREATYPLRTLVKNEGVITGALPSFTFLTSRFSEMLLLQLL